VEVLLLEHAPTYLPGGGGGGGAGASPAPDAVFASTQRRRAATVS
jgi:hypothetical protein